MQLAQANYSVWRSDVDPAQAKGFIDRIDEVNLLAERSPGFVWRYVSVEDDPQVLAQFGDRRVIFNMSVWESLDQLKRFAFTHTHAEVMKGRAQWFERRPESMSVLWWVCPGHRPSVAEARRRFTLLDTRGPGHEAFTFARVFPAPAVPESSA